MSTRSSDCLTMTTQETTTDSLPPPASKTDSCIFTCEIENIRMLIPVLKSICIKSMAVMTITERGLKFSCEEDSRVVQATALIEQSLFKRYEMRDKQTPETLCFRMSDLINVLSIMSSSSKTSRRNDSIQQDGDQTSTQHTVLKIKFETIERLKLQVVDGNHSAMAYIQTYNPQQLIVFSMSFVNKIIMDGSVLIDFWKLADTQSSLLYIKILDAEPWFEMATESIRGQFVQRISAHSVHIEHYECTVPLEEKYEMSAMHFTVRPLLLASKVCIRMDSKGLLNMQFSIKFDPNSDTIYGGSPKAGGRPRGGVFQNTVNQVQATPIPMPRTTPTDVQSYFVEFYIVPCVK